MPPTEETLATIELLYQAAMEPDLWPKALEKFAFSVGCVGMAMIPITPNDITGLVVSPSLDEMDVEYRREWWQVDSRVRRIFTRQLSAASVARPSFSATTRSPAIRCARNSAAAGG